MLHVVTEGHSNHVTRFTEDRSRGIVVLRSDKGTSSNFVPAIDELQSMDARHKALGFAAQQGMGDPRINGSPGSPYPVNAEGIPLEAIRGEAGEPLPLTHVKMKVGGYHIEIPVTRRIV